MHKSRCTYEEKNRLLKHEISVVIGIQMGSSLTKLQEPNGCVGSWLWSLLTVWSWLGQSVWWYRRMEERAPRYYMSDRDADRSDEAAAACENTRDVLWLTPFRANEWVKEWSPHTAFLGVCVCCVRRTLPS